MDVSVIIVSYNTVEDTCKCIDSVIEKTKESSYEIIVVDNNSQDNSANIISDKYKNVKVIANSINNGFAKANNQGFEIAQGDFIFFLNPDTILLNDVISILYKHIKESEKIGLIAPKLYHNLEREYHISISWFTTPFYMFIKFLPGFNFFTNIYLKYFFDKDKTQYGDWITGAALMLPKKVLLKVGSFDEDYFLYSEEEDLCWRLGKNNYKICYYPKAEIIHWGGKSSSQFKPKSMELFWNSKFIFFKKYYSNFSISLFKFFFIQLLKFKTLYSKKDKDSNKFLIEIIRKN